MNNIVTSGKRGLSLFLKAFSGGSRNKWSSPLSVWMAGLFVSLLFFTGQVYAGNAINSVTLNGGASTTVAPGATITVVVNNSGSSGWDSTNWFIGTTAPGTWNCDGGPTPSLTGNNQTYTFTITAPSSPGTYNAYFRTSPSTNCGSTNRSVTFTQSASVIVVVPPPTVTAINPTVGTTAGGTSVTITGTNFTSGATVTIGGNNATSVVVVNATTITAKTPAGTAGAQDVVVTASGGTGTGSGLFTYQAAPTVTAINPTVGTTAGGTSVTITGTGFIGATAVKIGGTNVTSFVVVNATTITAVTPAGTAGAKSVLVTTPIGTNAANTLFTYTTAPTVNSIVIGSNNPTQPAISVGWVITFSASVTNVDATDFSLVQGGGVSGATITSVTSSSGTSSDTSWMVVATTGTGTGTLGLNLVNNGSIVSTVGSASLGGAGYTGQVYTVSASFSCLPPPNVVATGITVSCYCDNFGRTLLNPSTIFGGNWMLSHATSDGAGTNPYINATTGLLRLTENTTNNAKAATVPGIFPAIGNYISVEFLQYAYQGGTTGADGVAVTLSDYSFPPVPGAFGGSLGFAQKNNASCVTPPCNGFSGGWVGVGMDEYGNYQNPTEGRIGGPGQVIQSVAARGPGSGLNGYRYLSGSPSALGGYNISADSTSTTPAPGNLYQVIVDATNAASGTINVSVNRDATTKDGTNYSVLLPTFNAWTEANYALSQGWITQVVPNYWQISFTGSTGGSTNAHEIGGLRICAQTIMPITGGTASGFSAIDSAYPAVSGAPAYGNFQSGHIYTKLTGTPFSLWVAALGSTSILTGYTSSSTGNKYVQVKFVDNSGNVCGAVGARTCNSTCTGQLAVETGASKIATFTTTSVGVASPSPSFTLNSAYNNLVAVMQECTTSACSAFTTTAAACSADSFSVRPLSIASVTSSAANNTSTVKAGNIFDLMATTTGITGYPSKYTGNLKINTTAIQAATSGILSGKFGGATSGTPSSTANGGSPSTFSFNEVGTFTLTGYDPASDTTSRRGVYDGVDTLDECTAPPAPAAALTTPQCDTLRSATWTGLDSVSTQNDCVIDSYSNTLNASGKYGCNFGLLATGSATFGRFIPDHFNTVIVPSPSPVVPMPCPTPLSCPPYTWSYANAPTRIAATGFVGGDIGKIAKQLDNSTLWMLTATTPTWSAIANSGFVYSGQSFALQVSALNASNVITKNYDSGKGNSKNVTLSAWDTLGGSTQVCSTCLTNTSVLSSAFATGVTTPAINPVYTFASALTAPTQIYVRAIDTDNVTSQLATATSSVEGGVMVVSGRTKVSNAYGSELLPLTLTATAQYYTATGWMNSITDSITLLTLTASYPVGAGATAVTLTPSSSNLSSGILTIKLGKPSAGAGTATISPTAPGYLPVTSGTATFGVYKGNSGYIYRSEKY